MSATSSRLQHIQETLTTLDLLIKQLEDRATEPGAPTSQELTSLRTRQDGLLREFIDLLPLEKRMALARETNRPQTLDYIRGICTNFTQSCGDRIMGDDPAIVGGLALLDQQPVVIFGHHKGKDIRERAHHNTGAARPSGYRKALRLVNLAIQLGVPVISLIDTIGADCSVDSEAFGISQAIAESQALMGQAGVPILAVVIGEGGSGGAIGIGVANYVAMLELAYYSVIAPQSCAAILWPNLPREEATTKAASALKLTAQDAHRFGFIEEIIPEPAGGAHRNPHQTIAEVKRALTTALAQFKDYSPASLAEHRYNRFRRMGEYLEL